MIRSSKHILKYNTNYKDSMLDTIFTDYREDLLYYIDLIISGQLPLKKNLSSKFLPTNKLQQSRWRQVVYKQSSEIIRSQIKSANERRYKRYKEVYYKCKQKDKCKWFTSKKYSELNLNFVLYTKWFTKPDISNITITLDQRFINIQQGNHFDEFIRITSPYFINGKNRTIKINVPIKQHKHSLKFKNWNRKNSIQLSVINNNYYMTLFYEKEQPEQKQMGNIIGIDQGYKKLLSCSDGETFGQELEQVYNKLTNKVKGSKSYKKLLIHKKNLINYYINQLNTNNTKEIVIEQLKKVKHKTKQKKSIRTKFMNKMQYWSYRLVTGKLERLCEENGVLLTKINPAYTSQTCSNCGCVDKKSRQGETYSCQHCGYVNDADINAAINIARMGVYSLHSPPS